MTEGEWKADYPDAQLMIDLHGYDQDFVTTERALEMVIRAFHPEAGQLPATVAELQRCSPLGETLSGCTRSMKQSLRHWKRLAMEANKTTLQNLAFQPLPNQQ